MNPPLSVEEKLKFFLEGLETARKKRNEARGKKRAEQLEVEVSDNEPDNITPFIQATSIDKTLPCVNFYY
jgi:hypothetical protein